MAVNTYAKVLYAGLQANYEALTNKDSNVLYFCTDSGKIYKGSVDFSKYCEAVSTRPLTPVVARLYLIASTGTAEFYDGSNWHVVSYKMVDSFDDESTSSSEVPTTNAVADYVASIIGGSSAVVKSIAAGTGEGEIVYTTADDEPHSVTVPLVGKTLAAGSGAAQVKLEHTTGNDDVVTVPGVVTGLASATGTGSDAKLAVTLSSGTHADVLVPGVLTAGGFSWNGTSRVLTLTDSNGTEHEANIGKDIFIDESANNRYENGNIYLYLNDGEGGTPTEIVIPVTGLITDYVGGDTNSVTLNVDSNTHIVTADVVRRPDTTGTGAFTNALKLSNTTGAEGLYVDNSEIEANIDGLGTAITWGSF